MFTEYALTTIDNPFDPFDQFSDWFAWDNNFDHGCCAILDRIAPVSDEMPFEEYEKIKSEAIDQFLVFDFSGIYKKISRKTTENGAEMT